MIPNQPTDIPHVTVVLFNDFSPFHVSIPGIVFSSQTLHETFFDLTFVAGET
ncbi:hypothetical protein [Marinomonas fungiae]|uniref:hypothetical protein n=1 Tax=Marinomonas fungiae TaxID=1137284 RepID=UPI003A8D60FC